jgi:regulation of enolase protein 1 (concanavalin A-like superfamily)/fibronectin type 3 domain-containing protein
MRRVQLRVLICFLFVLHFAVQAEAQLSIPRGRPHLNASRTTFVGDNGQDLRGPFTSTEWTGPVPASQIANLKNLGFNAVHLYAESFNTNYPAAGSQAPGYSAANVDAIVAETRTNGLYVVITIGNGAYNGNYNLAWVTNFWKFYAPRYANETHVIYEIQNEPVAWGPPYSSANATPPGAVNMEIAAYQVIRQYAPNTPVLLFTYAVFGGSGGASSALTDIHNFNTAVFGTANVTWTNEAVGFHGYAGWQGTSQAAAALISAGYPCMMTECAGGRWGTGIGGIDAELTSELERQNISWLTFEYTPPTGVSDDVTQPPHYQNIINDAGLSWTPDYGTWPAVRGPYGNGGQPRTIPASYVNNFLTGTPMRIQTEDFDTGGEGVAYHELTTTNSSGQYRPNEAVDIESTTDASGSYDVTSTVAGEWLEYTIWIQVPGYYNLSLRYAAPSNGCAVQVAGNQHDRTGIWALPSTGSSSTWMTVTQQVMLEPGRQKMRFTILNGGFNWNWFELTPAAKGIIPNGTYTLLNAANAASFTGVTSNNSVRVAAFTNSGFQQWNLQHIGGGQYKITAATNGWSWNLNNSALGFTSGWGTGGGQCFIMSPSGNGYYHIAPVSNGQTIQPSATNAAVLNQQAFSGSMNQQWALGLPGAPVFPSGVKASATSSTLINLKWNAVTNAVSYNIKRSPVSGGPYTLVATGVATTNFTDTVPVGMRFFYVVSAVTGGIESANSWETTCLPYPWQTQDVGSVGSTGNGDYSNGVFTVSGSGADIWGTADAFRYVYVPVTGNCTMIARVTSVQNIDPWSKAGIMIRESLNANAINAFIAVTPGNGVTWQVRSATGGSTVNTAAGGLSAPYWVKLVRSGNTFTGYRSADGNTWTQLGTQTFTMASTVYVGLVVTSHNNSSQCLATFDNVTGPGWSASSPPAAPAALNATVSNWNVGLTWNASGGALTYNVKRASTYGSYTSLGNVASTSFTDTTPSNNTDFYYVVSALNAAGESTNSPAVIVPAQIFTPSGLSVSPVSSNQNNLTWNAFPSATSYNVKSSPTSGGPYTTIASGLLTPNYTDTIAAGMKYYYVVSAISGGAETPNSVEATANLPYPWQTQDIGTVGVIGSASYNNGVFNVSGGGADIQNATDAFRYVYAPVNGDCTIIARVVSLQNVNVWSKAGVMIRESLNANAANAFIGITPGNGVTWQSRSSTGGSTAYNNTTGLTAPYWVKLVRSGNTFTGYRSADGNTWTQQGTAAFTMGSTVYIGLALTSHDTANLDPATFDNVTAPGWQAAAPPSTPASLTATAVSGSQINLIWNASLMASSYNVKRSSTNGGPYSIVYSGLGATNFSDTGLPSTNTFYYVISALNTSGESLNSSQASATTLTSRTPPTLAPIANQNIGAGVTLTITNVATDTNLPAPLLTFSLLSAPTNAAIDSASGLLTWRPLVTQANATNSFTVMVADDGTPSLSATQSFLVTVNPLALPLISQPSVSDGQFVLQVNGDSGPDYQIQASTNLSDWTTIFSTNSPAMPFFWTNQISTDPMNFYRVIVGP